jgi:hypothetical protein
MEFSLVEMGRKGMRKVNVDVVERYGDKWDKD